MTDYTVNQMDCFLDTTAYAPVSVLSHQMITRVSRLSWSFLINCSEPFLLWLSHLKDENLEEQASYVIRATTVPYYLLARGVFWDYSWYSRAAREVHLSPHERCAQSKKRFFLERKTFLVVLMVLFNPCRSFHVLWAATANMVVLHVVLRTEEQIMNLFSSPEQDKTLPSEPSCRNVWQSLLILVIQWNHSMVLVEELVELRIFSVWERLGRDNSWIKAVITVMYLVVRLFILGWYPYNAVADSGTLIAGLMFVLPSETR